jgi:phosphonopyruvate decarboxylase
MTETIRDFLPPEVFYNQLMERGMDFFAGVPDSLLADFCGYLADNAPENKHVITANEGTAISLAAGYHMATRRFPVVYL